MPSRSRHSALATSCLWLCLLPASAQMVGQPFEMPAPGYSGTPAPNVRKITDGNLTCEQIYAESTSLEATISTQQAAVAAAQKEAQKAQDSMISGAMSSPGTGVATSILGMIPGAGIAAGLASQAAIAAQQAAAQQSATDMNQAYQRMATLSESLAQAQARNDYLIGLFLQKNCKAPGG